MMFEFFRVHQASLWLIGALSVVVFAGTLVGSGLGLSGIPERKIEDIMRLLQSRLMP